jgi:hypothetical protein
MTSTETKPSPLKRLFRYGTRTLFVLMTLVCIGLAWYTYDVHNRKRVLCDQLVDTVLIRCHFEAWQDSTEHEMLVKSLTTDLTSTPGFRASILRLDGNFTDGTAADAFEKDLIAGWNPNPLQAAPGGKDYAERGSMLSSKYTYYKAVRSSVNCAACHRQLGSKPGEVIAVVKIELAK